MKKKKNILYANGCSHTAGGGLDYMSCEYKGKKIYAWKELYDIDDWGNEKNIMYPQRIADYFGIPCVNEASSGSGAPRLIRKTYEYIIENINKKIDDHIFLLQFNNPVGRIEYYSRKINDYIIINPEWTKEGKIDTISIVDNYSVRFRKYDPNFFKEDIKKDIIHFLENYHDPIKYYENFIGQCAGLISFLEQLNIEYFYTFSDGGPLTGRLQKFWSEPKRKERNLIIDECRDISEFADKYKCTIEDETNGILGDRHAGYFAQIKYAEKICKILENNFEIERNTNKNDLL